MSSFPDFDALATKAAEGAFLGGLGAAIATGINPGAIAAGAAGGAIVNAGGELAGQVYDHLLDEMLGHDANQALGPGDHTNEHYGPGPSWGDGGGFDVSPADLDHAPAGMDPSAIA